ncbi:3-hydroxyisobutyryl-CoA hydrolase 1-like [Wolffia australiana]
MASWKGENDDTNQVLVEARNHVRVIILNRPRQLNALSYEMISKLLKLFEAFDVDPAVKLLIMKGEGRAFCAGGDVAAVAKSIIEDHWSQGVNFFRKEFTLNYIISTFNKPQVSLLNGIVMGGGAGVSIHGRFRVATETSVFAMPETALGLFPDIGASYFLSRLPGYFGEYVGLTGARLDGVEMLACGLATHFVPSMRLSLLEESLIQMTTADPNSISAVINKFSESPTVKQSSVFHRLDIVDQCFCRGTVEEIVHQLEVESRTFSEEWITAAIRSIKKASPLSLKISLRSIREGRHQDIGQCLIREHRMVSHILRGEISKDFFEGCRAILIDKDKNPKWGPSILELVTEDMVRKFFAPVDDPAWEDLSLPQRGIQKSKL